MMGLESKSMFSGAKAHILKHDALLSSSIIERCSSPLLRWISLSTSSQGRRHYWTGWSVCCWNTVIHGLGVLCLKGSRALRVLLLPSFMVSDQWEEQIHFFVERSALSSFCFSPGHAQDLVVCQGPCFSWACSILFLPLVLMHTTVPPIVTKNTLWGPSVGVWNYG